MLFSFSAAAQESVQVPGFTQAVELAHQAVAAYPERSQSYFALGYAYLNNMKFEKAIEAYKQGLAIEPANAQIMTVVGDLYKKLNRHEQAVEWYQKSLKQDPHQPGVNENLGLSLVQRNRMQEAREAFAREIEIQPRNASAHFYLAQRYFEAGAYDKAETHAKTCIQYDARVSEPYYLLGRIYRQKGEMEKSQSYLETFRQQKQTEYKIVDAMEKSALSTAEKEALVLAKTHQFFGQAAIQAEDWPKAEEHLRRAIEMDPHLIDAHTNLFTLLQRQKRPGEAEAQLKQALKSNPENSELRLMLGMFHLSQKNYAEGIKHVEQVVERSPQHSDAKRVLAEALLRSGGDAQRAMNLLLEVTQQEATAPDLNLLSWAYFQTGHYQESLSAMERALRLAPNNQDLQNRYIKLRSRLRQMNQAAQE